MSGIGAIGGSNSQVNPYASQSSSDSAATQSAGAAGGDFIIALLFDQNSQTSSNGASPSNGSPTTTQGAGGLTDLRQQIDQAVTNAIQTYEAGNNSSSNGGGSATSSTGSTSAANGSGAPDILRAISDAINQTLQQNGIDPQQLQQQAGTGGHHHQQHAESSSENSSQSGSATDSTASLLAGGLDSGTEQGLNLLDQLLQSNGANSPGGQLASNLLATSDAASQNSSLSNLAQLLGSLPVGSNVNALA